jgi:adenylosuccinate synthase
MVNRIVVVSGRVASGKSSLARDLCRDFKGKRYSTHEMLVQRLGVHDPGRRALQKEGERLDRRSNGSWVRDDLSRDIYALEGYDLAVVDSARILPQIEYLRESFGRRVTHIHVTASEKTIRKRYELRRRARKGELPSYEEVRSDPTEAQVESLAEHADLVIDTDRCLERDVLIRAARSLGLLSGAPSASVDALVGGEYGSEGKGNVAFYLAPEYDLLIRVGGPNAGHKVALQTGEHYTHHHLPSGTRAGEAQLLIGPGNVIRVSSLLQEIADCEVEQDRLSIDPRAMVIEDTDIRREKGLQESIGSTRQGVGWATARRVLRGADKRMAKVRMAGDIDDLTPFLKPAAEVLEDAYSRGLRIMLEGTQGTGLSLYHGAYPHVTSRDTSVAGTLSEAGIAPHRLRRCVLVCRTYPIRVESPSKDRSSGPMSKEISWAEVERRAGVRKGTLLKSEKTSTTNKQRRVGEFEWDLLRRSALLNGPTDIALTFVDYLGKENLNARRFDQLTRPTMNFIDEVERVAGAPVSLVSTGFTQRPAMVDRRTW